MTPDTERNELCKTQARSRVGKIKGNRGMMTLLAIMTVLFGCLSGQASANVMGFDFGSTFFKITLV